MLKDKLLISLFIGLFLVFGNSVFAETAKENTDKTTPAQVIKEESQKAVESLEKAKELKSYIQPGYEDVQKTFDKLIIGYSNSQLDTVMNTIADDEHDVFFGTGARYVLVGKENIKKAFSIDFDTLRNLRIQVPWISISGKGDVAWLNAVVNITLKLANQEKFVSARQTIVFEKINNEWKIVSNHLSFPAMEIVSEAVNKIKSNPKVQSLKNKKRK